MVSPSVPAWSASWRRVQGPLGIGPGQAEGGRAVQVEDIASDAIRIDVRAHERGRVGRVGDEVRPHAIGLEPPSEQASVRVVRDAPEEGDVLAEAGDRAGRVVRPATGIRRLGAVRADDEVDEGLARDDDHARPAPVPQARAPSPWRPCRDATARLFSSAREQADGAPARWLGPRLEDRVVAEAAARRAARARCALRTSRSGTIGLGAAAPDRGSEDAAVARAAPLGRQTLELVAAASALFSASVASGPA